MDTVKQRISYWDNVKAILIYLVVFAHFLIILRYDTESRLVQVLNLYIYLFHMPAFVMVSGYFSKKYVEKGFDVNKLIGLFFGFYCYKILLWISESIAGSSWLPFSFFAESGAPWYLICLFWWLLLLPIFSRIGYNAAIITSIVLMLLVGLDTSATNFLSIVKMVNFLPFFIIGYYYDPKKKPDRKAGIAGLIVLILLFIVLYLGYDMVMPYEHFVYGDVSYEALKLDVIKGFCYKTVWFVSALVLSYAIFAVAPAEKHFFTKAGKCSLGIYVFHRLFRPYFLILWKEGSPLDKNGCTIIISAAVVSVLVTALFSAEYFTTITNAVLRKKYITRSCDDHNDQ